MAKPSGLDGSNQTPHKHHRIHSAASTVKSHLLPSNSPAGPSQSSASLAPPVGSAMSSSTEMAGQASQPNAGATGIDSLDDTVKYSNIIAAARNSDKQVLGAILSGEKGETTLLERLSVLHSAVQCSTTSVVQYVLSFYTADHPELDINAQDAIGDTPLHLAVRASRPKIVAALLQRADINDTVMNKAGATPVDLATSEDIQQMLANTRLAFSKICQMRIQEYISQGDYDRLETMLKNPRVLASVDLNSAELATGHDQSNKHSGTLLHEAARGGDEQLVRILLQAGAKPTQRDRKGKRPQDVARRDSVRVMLKQSAAAEAADPAASLSTSSMLAAGMAAPDQKEAREKRGYLYKWTNYAAGYRRRWFVLENGVLSYYKDQTDTDSACRGAINMRIAKFRPRPRDQVAFEVSGDKSSVTYSLKADSEQEARDWIWVISTAIRWAKDQDEQQKRQVDELAASAHSDSGLLTAPDGASIRSSRSKRPADEPDDGLLGPTASRVASRTISQTMDDYDSTGDDGDSSNGDLYSTNKDRIGRTIQALRLELESASRLTSLIESYVAANPSVPLGESDVTKAVPAYTRTVSALREQVDNLERIAADSERGWLLQLRLWEESMSRYAVEHEELQAKIGVSEEKRKQQRRLIKGVLMEARPGTVPAESGVLVEGDPNAGAADASAPATESANSKTRGAAEQSVEEAPVPGPLQRRNTVIDPALFESESDGEDEFFDALNEGQLDVVDATAQQAGKAESDESVLRESFKGYEDPVRTMLDITIDDRPKISLWGILRSMIGMDMTRMTLPVSFNEPTSLLHRVAEDMEYADLLDIAAKEAEATKRMLYVAAFAASEYASTIGRIAKPFNPLLAETFEYSRPDKGYRFFAEQVSHHPPIGAAFAESDHWEYWGESAVKSQFYGKSFDINPLGTWFLRLKLAGGKTELYTWKKVTSSVVGIITGNPAVENYGDMNIVNHDSGDVGSVTFVRSGLLRSAKCQMTGKITSGDGGTAWTIHGHWNNQIHAKAGSGDQNGQVLLLWQANERRKDIPFNLTSFAVTFNALPDRLRPYLAPTDSRFRPDQRAMEQGNYDLAATEKTRLENVQRRHRAEREKRAEEYQPRWFKKDVCGKTGEKYWRFSGDYWTTRERVGRGEVRWEDQGLEPIFPPLDEGN